MRVFTPLQARQNAAFLRALRRTGNSCQAGRDVGVHRATFESRRKTSPSFAAEWDAALAVAHAALHARAQDRETQADRDTVAEPSIIRRADGRLQLRRPRRGRLTRADEQTFLAALSATANIRLSAAAAGFSSGTFYHRRKTSTAFRREMKLALQMGYDRLELALLESFTVESCRDDAWCRNDPPPIPPMTANQALHLLTLHQKEARLLAEPDHIRRRRGESSDARSYRLAAMYVAQQNEAREAFRIAETIRRSQGKPSGCGPKDLDELVPRTLPALDQVTGWSLAKPGSKIFDAGTPLFGGWRIRDWGDWRHVRRGGKPGEGKG